MPISEAGSNPPERGYASLRRSTDHGFTCSVRSAEHGSESLERSAEHGSESLERSVEHGFESLERSAENGFTLVELMVVVTIIALASAAAVLAMPDPRGRVLDEAMRFAARARSAHDAAIVGDRPVSLWVTTGGYGFDRRVAGRWLPLAEAPLRVASWNDGTRAVVPDEGGRTRVTFDSTGLVDRPADVRLTRAGAAAVVRIGADGSVRADAE